MDVINMLMVSVLLIAVVVATTMILNISLKWQARKAINKRCRYRNRLSKRTENKGV